LIKESTHKQLWESDILALNSWAFAFGSTLNTLNPNPNTLYLNSSGSASAADKGGANALSFVVIEHVEVHKRGMGERGS
jgi:hypothetical protein